MDSWIKWPMGWLSLLAWGGLLGCEPRQEVLTTSPEARLGFSRDTVLFDTLLTDRLSLTRRLWIYNPSANAVETDLRLAGGENSPYRLVVNGQEARPTSRLRLLGRDSALLLVTARVPPGQRDLPFVVRDSVLFTTNGNAQKILLLAYGRDAVYLRNVRLRGAHRWSGSRPYVLVGNVLVDSLATLQVAEGVQVLLDAGANLLVAGQLRVEGSPGRPVVFTSSRQDGAFADAPGQWGGLYFLEGSRPHYVGHARLRNGTFGLRLGRPDADTLPDLVVENTIIENMREVGIAAFTSDLQATNTVVSNCIGQLVLCVAGGHYRLRHCTLANSQTRFLREGPSVVASNTLLLDNGQNLDAPLGFWLENSIVWGDQADELGLVDGRRSPYTAEVRNCLVRSSLNNLAANRNLANQNPRFVSAPERNFRLDSLSPAVNLGAPLGIRTDLLGRPRSPARPDAGAYERRD
ncbi:MAG: right-handed parallel beta-helix repeat-containing protein [Bernardetiaceae bacterium]|nr:right-handed parallel beta-helix repeat-containing protein [Bernardetiaceae bacterium]